MNLHGGGESTGYTPIADNGQDVREARPEYYGMLLFSMAAQGSIMRVAASSAGPWISAWAVHGRDDSIRVALIDRSEGDNVMVDSRIRRVITSM